MSCRKVLMRCRWIALVFMLLCCGRVWSQSQTSATRLKPCRAHPRLVGECFSVRGRLSTYNGGPSTRLWKVGSRRILGVLDVYGRDGYRIIPVNIEKLLDDGQTEVWGDYLACPLTRQKPKVMQMICIESGKNLSARKRQ